MKLLTALANCIADAIYDGKVADESILTKQISEFFTVDVALLISSRDKAGIPKHVDCKVIASDVSAAFADDFNEKLTIKANKALQYLLDYRSAIYAIIENFKPVILQKLSAFDEIHGQFTMDIEATAELKKVKPECKQVTLLFTVCRTADEQLSANNIHNLKYRLS